MLLIEYVVHLGHKSLTDGHLGRHLEYFKMLNDARVASVWFIKYNASTTRINKEQHFKIKFQVILFYWTIIFALDSAVVKAHTLDLYGVNIIQDLSSSYILLLLKHAWTIPNLFNLPSQ